VIEERAMSARKLSRFAGVVLALAVVFGGVGLGAAATESTTASVLNTTNLEWY
jgi:hypothetical protein